MNESLIKNIFVIIPCSHWSPILPAVHMQSPLVGSHVLLPQSQSNKQFFPYLPVGQAKTEKFYFQYVYSLHNCHTLHLNVKGNNLCNSSINILCLIKCRNNWSDALYNKHYWNLTLVTFVTHPTIFAVPQTGPSGPVTHSTILTVTWTVTAFTPETIRTLGGTLVTVISWLAHTSPSLPCENKSD